MLFMGLDAGTQGVRVIICDENGTVAGESSVRYPNADLPLRLTAESAAELPRGLRKEPGIFEQDPACWERATEKAVHAAVSDLKKNGKDPKDIRVMAVDATCCTILPVDKDGRPLHNAIMYNDLRAEEQAEKLQPISADYQRDLGIRQSAILGPARYLWFMEKRPDIYEKTALFLNQSDYISGLFSGRAECSDSSCALKAGYDILRDCWPEYLEKAGIDREKLPRVSFTGTHTGKVCKAAAERFGLSEGTIIAAGSTDAYASAISAGIKKPGDWASVLGTTLVLKGVTDSFRKDPEGVAVTHSFPGGLWLASGASNIGGICLNEHFSSDEFDEYNKYVKQTMPSGLICYPLTVKGERYPFMNTQASAFFLMDMEKQTEPLRSCQNSTVFYEDTRKTASMSDTKLRDLLRLKAPHILYTGLMEGVAFTQRLGLEHQEKIGNQAGPELYAAGGACKSAEWLNVQANVLNRSMNVPAVPEAAFGMAVVSAMHYYGSLQEASANMVRIQRRIDPDPSLACRYDSLYAEFLSECKRKGYI